MHIITFFYPTNDKTQALQRTYIFSALALIHRQLGHVTGGHRFVSWRFYLFHTTPSRFPLLSVALIGLIHSVPIRYSYQSPVVVVGGSLRPEEVAFLSYGVTVRLRKCDNPLHCGLSHCLHCREGACTAGRAPALPGGRLHCREGTCTAGRAPALPGGRLHCREGACTAGRAPALPGGHLHCREGACPTLCRHLLAPVPSVWVTR